MAPSDVGVEAPTCLLPAPRPLDVAMMAPATTGTTAATTTTTMMSLSATAADDAAVVTPSPYTALKLADCIGRISAALAELGETVEALKGKKERGE